MKEHGPWKVRSTQEVHRNAWLALTGDEVVRPDGTAGTFSIVRMIPGVCVLALDDRGCVHLAEEFRYAVGRVSLEAVGGRCPPCANAAADGRERRGDTAPPTLIAEPTVREPRPATRTP